LPISARAEEITAAIQAHQVVVLAGETGSGKTTQIPKMCLAAGCGSRGRIVCTQPRRVAALSISRRVAEEMGVEWGGEVGCKVRFSDQTSRATLIKFVTDGMLLAELQSDPMLREYDTVIIDEAHERSLNIDFLLGHLRGLRFKRPELKIVITSATIDTAAFSAAFDGAPVVLVEGRAYPVEVIYAPLDRLGRDYAENDENEEKEDAAAIASAKAEALHYIDGTVEAVERIVGESDRGDVLAFLPSERDIREVRDLLDGRRMRDCEIVPLFGRLSNAEQQRVFAATQRRKIVLATNIAETSLTIPGIRFVVDTGLARISRYSAQSRTRRLPIEEIAQSSAEQRKGRAGRVAEGVCIRLYSEQDFLARPRFTQPEIQRANLADVILRMKAFGLGDIERFPFINLPAVKAVRAGYALLEELGAIETGRIERPGELPTGEDAAPYAHELTAIGRELARLPVDPGVGRMILQARREKALREVAVIAAGLSIQDPRERPLDQQQQADAAHRRFTHADSDFLTLLNIWDAYHEQFETLSQARLRRFCREHFLSYTRMREWRDIHAQLMDVLQERDDFKMTSALGGPERTPPDHAAGGRGAAAPKRGPGAPAKGEPAPPRPKGRAEAPPDPLAFGTPAYRAIHRSVLAGLLGNIAYLDEETGGYKATHDRRVVLFPGSVLFRKEDRTRTAGSKPAEKKDGRRQPRWIMAAEIVETTRLYARTCARLDPQWALELGEHLVRIAHSEPFWNEAAGRVMVKQQTRLYGLELDRRAVGYGKIDPLHATELFIREGLVNDTITFPLDFVTHNRAVRENVADLLTRARDSGYLNLDEAACRFYAARLLPGERSDEGGGSEAGAPAGVSSVAELVDLVRHRQTTDPRFLFMAPEDLRDPDTITVDADAFPQTVPLANEVLPLNYTYRPGQADDGVTVNVTVREAEALTPAALDWAVPGHIEPKVEHYLRALPKELRRAFVPLADTAKALADLLRKRAGISAADVRTPAARPSQPTTLVTALTAVIAERYRVSIDPAVWADKPPPDHLRVRIRVADNEGRELCAGRDLAELRAALLSQSREASIAVAREEPAAWRAARAQWETPEHRTWAFEAAPDRVLVSDQGGAPVYAFPGLRAGEAGIARRLFKTPEDAAASTREAIAQMLERELGHDLMWTQRDLRALRELGPLTATLAPIDQLQEDAFAAIRRWATDPRRIENAGGRPHGGLGAAGSSEALLASDLRPVATQARFQSAVAQAKTDLRGLVPRLGDLLREVLALRLELLVVADPPPGQQRDVGNLLPAHFLATTPFTQLAHYPRYLKAMKLRAERWRKNPGKDADRAAQIVPYEKALDELRRKHAGGPRSAAPRPWGEAAARGGTSSTSPSSEAIESFRWLIEEYRVSLFAQELGTAEPVSAVKLDRALAELRAQGQPAASDGHPRPAAVKPIVAAPVADQSRKPTVLKHLGALDRLFQK
jgi:ATP-dependent helicase HrpA